MWLVDLGVVDMTYFEIIMEIVSSNLSTVYLRKTASKTNTSP